MNKTMAGVTLAAVIVAFGAQAREGPIEIEKCQTISQPGSYKLVNNLTFTADTGACLQITVSSVTIDLAGFTISGPGNGSANNFNGSVGILTILPSPGQVLEGLAVRNGSISGFGFGVLLGGDGSVVEGLHVFGGGLPVQGGIEAVGIVKGNTVVDIVGLGVGISATGIVTGNYVTNTGHMGMNIGPGSTVIANTVTHSGAPNFGAIFVTCPSNVTDNTSVNNNPGAPNLSLGGNGCNETNNVAP